MEGKARRSLANVLSSLSLIGRRCVTCTEAANHSTRMTSLTLEGVATFLTLLALVGGAYEGTPSYYWSRSKVGTAHVSRRAHIGPLPHVNDFMTEWSPWGAWARCSRSCGGGVRSRVRTCVAKFPRVMPGSGIRTSHDHCSGDSKQYDVCGTRPCVTEEVAGLSFRAAQCRRYNNRRVFGRLVNNWVPYVQEGMNPCSLVCEGEGQGIVYTFGKVTDGTHCKIRDKGRDGLCVNGRCLPLSCDGRLGGTAREDMCRVCAGRNDTCIHHVGVFHTDLPYPDLAQPPPPPLPPPLPPTQGNMVHRPPPLPPPPSPPPPVPRQRRRLGYYEVTRLPPGATNIRVRDKSPNFLALKSGGKFLLNGDWLIDWPGEVEAGGRPSPTRETRTTLKP
ncbi:ADAMTS-like protein 5 [Scylla paramamosain]|uniref:ADAMTS-like protein 5 n=1 Tax=Scylla paramamosain TaxID=85552 RepID=UPI003083A7B3